MLLSEQIAIDDLFSFEFFCQIKFGFMKLWFVKDKLTRQFDLKIPFQKMKPIELQLYHVWMLLIPLSKFRFEVQKLALTFCSDVCSSETRNQDSDHSSLFRIFCLSRN